MSVEGSGPIAFVAYPGLTPLDLVGPLQVLSAAAAAGLIPPVVVVAANREVLDTDTALGLAPSHIFAEVPAPWAVIVPGGAAPTLKAMLDPVLVDYVRRAGENAERVCSVCTGALVLGAAGLLRGRRATTHWAYQDLLPRFGAAPAVGRWVSDGPVLTAAGVAAGIDMAFHLLGELAGDDVARTVQFGLEYDPVPPLGALDWSGAPRERFAEIRELAIAEGWAELPTAHPWTVGP